MPKSAKQRPSLLEIVKKTPAPQAPAPQPKVQQVQKPQPAPAAKAAALDPKYIWNPSRDREWQLLRTRWVARDQAIVHLAAIPWTSGALQRALQSAVNAGKKASVPTSESGLQTFTLERRTFNLILSDKGIEGLDDEGYSLLRQVMSESERKTFDCLGYPDKIQCFGEIFPDLDSAREAFRLNFGRKALREYRAAVQRDRDAEEARHKAAIKHLMDANEPILNALYAEYRALKPSETSLRAFLEIAEIAPEPSTSAAQPPAPAEGLLSFVEDSKSSTAAT